MRINVNFTQGLVLEFIYIYIYYTRIYIYYTRIDIMYQFRQISSRVTLLGLLIKTDCF